MEVRSFREHIGQVVKFKLPREYLCPCGSKKRTYLCCLTPAGLVKKPSKLLPPSPATNTSLMGCYAAKFSDCNTKISREHFISESLLREVDRIGGLTVRGFSWQETGEAKRVSPNSFASKIMCGRHNAALSPLDSMAGTLFKALYDIQTSVNRIQQLHLFNGHDIERWLLKVLCGLIMVDKLAEKHGAKNEILPQWLDILFGYAEFSERCGLYFCKDAGNIVAGPVGVLMRPIVNSDRICGLGVVFCGYEFVLSMDGFPERVFDGRNFAYRPLEIYVSGTNYEKSVLLSWQGQADLGTIMIDHDQV